MWNDRFDDLWLYPMPEWFVRFCNRFVGAHALELILISEILGLVAIVAGFAGDWFWLQIVGYVLLAPGPLLIAMMVVTAEPVPASIVHLPCLYQLACHGMRQLRVVQ